MQVAKSKKRSALRVRLGQVFYLLKTRLDWLLHTKQYQLYRAEEDLPEVIFTHRTFLRRPLKDVDMQLQENKITNLRLAIQELDGLILEPGKTLSYWQKIGRPTKRRGFIEGLILNHGQVDTSIGGGLCQLSNLIYWLTLHTPLTVSERWRHSFDVFPDVKRKLPFGSGATCSYPNIDLRIKNKTEQKFQLKLYLTETHLVGEWRSDKLLDVEYRVYEKDHSIQHQTWGGYTRHNRIMRETTNKKTGEVTEIEEITQNHAMMMYAPLLENKKTGDRGGSPE